MSTPEERLRLIRVKIERAKKHIRDLKAARDAFIDSKPYVVGFKYEPDATVYYLSSVRETPIMITAIAGDVLFNLRAALDHLVCALIVAAGGSDCKDVGFTILKGAPKDNAAPFGRIKGVPLAAMDQIYATEPYQGGKGHILWQLNHLNIIDKHRMLITAGCGLATIRMHPTKRSQIHKAIHAEAGYTLTDEQALARVPLAEKSASLPCPLKKDSVLHRDLFANEEVDPNDQFTFDVAFNEPQIIGCDPLLPTLEQMVEFVDGLITAFKQWL